MTPLEQFAVRKPDGELDSYSDDGSVRTYVVRQLAVKRLGQLHAEAKALGVAAAWEEKAVIVSRSGAWVYTEWAVSPAIPEAGDGGD